MQNLPLLFAVLWGAAVAKTRFRSASTSCAADLPVAVGWGGRAAFEKVLAKALPNVDLGYGKNSSVRAEAKAHGPEDEGEGCLEDVYGEVTTKGLMQLYGLLHLSEDDVFADLGSGLGKQPIRAAVLGGARAALGVELSAKRHALACKGLEAAAAALRVELNGKAPARTSRVELIRGDMFKQDLSSATVVFMNSVCFRDPMMAELGQKLARELPGSARIASLKPFVAKGLPPRLASDPGSIPRIDTTWSSTVDVWLLRTPPEKGSTPLGDPGKPLPK